MKKLLLGNVITVDDKNPLAFAIVVNDGIIEYVGNKEDAKKLIDRNSEIIDYGNNYIYPGFIESHCHGIFAGYRAIGQADLSPCLMDYDAYGVVIKKYIEDNPGKDYYLAAGWAEDGRLIDHTFLDNICADLPLIMNTVGGHSMLLNLKAMEKFGINEEFLNKYGKERVHVDENGKPNGYICEEAAVWLLNVLSPNVEDSKKYLLKWQDIAISKGLTAVVDAGDDLIVKEASRVYSELEKENKLKLRTYSYKIVKDNCEDPKAAIEGVLDYKKQYSNEYYNIIGAKVFLDGVAEARTSWTVDEYEDEKGYYGVSRFNDEEKLTAIFTEASKNNLSIHMHSEGDGATSFALRCIKKSQEETKDFNQRNVLAHLHFVKEEDFKNMKDTNTIAAVPPLWTPKFPSAYETEVKSFGKRADKSYPIASFVNAGATVVYHTDYPISPIIDISRSIYCGEKRAIPEPQYGGMATQRNPKEVVDRMTSLKAMTINCAYEVKQEDRLGSIEKGKIANFTVYDKNFLNDSIDDVLKSKLIATIIDGNVEYSDMPKVEEISLLKRIFSYKNIIICLFTAIGYGFGWVIPLDLGLGNVLSLLICLVVGYLFYFGTEALFRSKLFLENKSSKVLILIVVLLLYIISWIIIMKMYAFDNNSILLINFIWVTAFEIAIKIYNSKKK